MHLLSESPALARAAGAAATPPTSRMAPCPCGSGERYKNCCGGDRLPRIDAVKRGALQAQRGSDLQAAIRGYREVLAQQPDDDDALHMLALCHLQLGCVAEALALITQLLRRLPVAPDAVWQNLNLVVAAAACAPEDALTRAMRTRYGHWRQCARNARADGRPTLSVVIPSYNHARFVATAIASVLAQSRTPDEIIVIDDGSSDGSIAVIEQALAGSAITHRVIARGNRGAAETLNEAIAMASGDWIAPLNSDDQYAPGRLAQLLEACARDGIDWGFGSVDIVASDGVALSRRDRAAADIYAAHDSVHMSDGVGLAFVRNNPAVSTGNLFFRKSLWQRVGGFASLRYNHDWRFCLDAARLAEPLFVPAARYGYRWHGGNTISDSDSAPRREALAMFRDYLAVAPARHHDDNPFAPSAAAWGRAWLALLAAGGNLQALPATQLLSHLEALT